MPIQYSAIKSKLEYIQPDILSGFFVSKFQKITDNPAHDVKPFWSPNGNKIIFTSNRDGEYKIYEMSSDGKQLSKLTLDHAMCPSCSPEGKKIVFYSLIMDVPDDTEKRYWYDCNSEIYIMNADGTEHINLSNNPAYDGYPNWSPIVNRKN